MPNPAARERYNERRRVRRALFRLEHPRSPRSHNKIKKSCIYCGTEFWVFPCLRRVECCSRGCAAKLKGAIFTGRVLKRKPPVRYCPGCGEVTEIKRGRGRCRACFNARSAERMRRYGLVPEKLERRRASARKFARKIQADPERRRIKNIRMAEVYARRRAAKDATKVARISYLRILDTWGMTCSICGKGIKDGELSFDHVIPLVRGGAHVEDNIKPAHTRCNVRKNRRLPEELHGLC